MLGTLEGDNVTHWTQWLTELQHNSVYSDNVITTHGPTYVVFRTEELWTTDSKSIPLFCLRLQFGTAPNKTKGKSLMFNNLT
jgi:hypothetical protein